LNAYFVHNPSTGCPKPVDNRPKSFHNVPHLSTVSVDNSHGLWIKVAQKRQCRSYVVSATKATCG
jgi:hypothetical protein